MPDSSKNLKQSTSALNKRSRSRGDLLLGVWLHLMWTWCHVSTWGHAISVLGRKIMVGHVSAWTRRVSSLGKTIARRLRRVRRLKAARRLTNERFVVMIIKSLTDPIKEWFVVRVIKPFRDSIMRTARQAHDSIMRTARQAHDSIMRTARQAQRMQRRLENRAALVLFERLKESGKTTEIIRYFERRYRARLSSAGEVAGLIDFSLACGNKTLARACADTMFERFPHDIDMQEASAVRCFLLGEYALAEDIWSRSAEVRERQIAERGLDRLNFRYLGPSWFIAIGHIAHLDTYLKHHMLSGAGPRHHAPIIPAHFKIPNAYFLDLWRPLLAPIASPVGLSLELEEVELVQDEFWSLRIEPGRTLIYHKAGAAVQKAWDESGRPPLLELPPDDVRKGWEVLESLGVPAGSWFVCLHVREAGFHQSWHQSHPGTRNADVNTYYSAIEAIVERGGYVIRVGDSTMAPLTPMPGAIDYAHSAAKSDFMDVFLCARCSFFIGTNSGLGLVPPVFGVPCAMTNWSPIAIPQWYPRDLFVPKLVLREEDNRLLSFEELYATAAGWEQFETYFREHRLRVVDNSPDELRDVTVEMLERISGTVTYSTDDEQRRAVFERLAEHHVGYVGSRIGRDFLRKHAELLPVSEASSARPGLPLDHLSLVRAV